MGSATALDGTLWGGEFLLADYRTCERLATFKPIAMPGGVQAIREPWRNTYAKAACRDGLGALRNGFFRYPVAPVPSSEAARGARRHDRWKNQQPVGQLLRPPVRCGRSGRRHLSRARGYEGQAAVEFEALADAHTLAHEDERLAYPFAIARPNADNLPYVEPLPMWQALLGDLVENTPLPVVSARFHKGLADAIVRMVDTLRQRHAEITTLALSGGVLENRLLLELLIAQLEVAWA